MPCQSGSESHHVEVEGFVIGLGHQRLPFANELVGVDFEIADDDIDILEEAAGILDIAGGWFEIW